MREIAGYKITLHNHGYFRLDGGSMFGSVPRKLWERLITPDQDHCIRLATRSLLLRKDDRVILVDVGNGDKWNEKMAKIYGIENTPAEQLGFVKDEVTDVILTHLHFDHGGGISYFDESGLLKPSYPNATVHVQRSNYELAKAPNVRERASYLAENVEILEQVELNLLQGSAELFAGIWVHELNGHTRGQQAIEVRDESDSLFFPTDLCPTSHHLALPYHMGFDMCVDTLLEEKEHFFSRALERNQIIVFEHDPEISAARIRKNEKGRYEISEQIEF